MIFANGSPIGRRWEWEGQWWVQSHVCPSEGRLGCIANWPVSACAAGAGVAMHASSTSSFKELCSSSTSTQPSLPSIYIAHSLPASTATESRDRIRVTAPGIRRPERGRAGRCGCHESFLRRRTRIANGQQQSHRFSLLAGFVPTTPTTLHHDPHFPRQ